jgi:hypothetical protein
LKHFPYVFNLGIGKLSTGDGKHLTDPEVLRRLTSSVSCALDEAAAALTRMRSENPRPQTETRYDDQNVMLLDKFLQILFYNLNGFCCHLILYLQE